MGRVADAEANHEHAPRRGHRQQRNVNECAHVALVERRGRRHRVAVREQGASAPRPFGNRQDVGHALAHRQQPLRRRRRPGGHDQPDSAQADAAIASIARATTTSETATVRVSRAALARRRRRAQIERRERHPRSQREDGSGSLDAEARQQQVAGGERTEHGAGSVCEIQHAGPAPDRALGVLDHGVAERKGRAHQQRGHADFEEHRPCVEPQLRESSGACGVDRVGAVDGQTCERKHDEQRLNDDERECG